MTTTIDPQKEYSLKEIIDMQLIPQVDSYNILYQMATYPQEVVNPFFGSVKRSGMKDERERIVKRFPCSETTMTSIKVKDNPARAGKKINAKMLILGEEIQKFLALNS